MVGPVKQDRCHPQLGLISRGLAVRAGSEVRSHPPRRMHRPGGSCVVFYAPSRRPLGLARPAWGRDWEAIR